MGAKNVQVVTLWFLPFQISYCFANEIIYIVASMVVELPINVLLTLTPKIDVEP